MIMINNYRNRYLNSKRKVDSQSFMSNLKDDFINLFEYKLNLRAEYVISESSIEFENTEIQTLIQQWEKQRRAQDGQPD